MHERTYIFYADFLNISLAEAKRRGKKALDVEVNFKNRKLSRIRNAVFVYTKSHLELDTQYTEQYCNEIKKESINLLASLKAQSLALIKKFANIPKSSHSINELQKLAIYYEIYNLQEIL